jgi:hypothetical protein
MKVVRLSALNTGRIYLPGDKPGTRLCYGLRLFQGRSAERLSHLKIPVTPSESLNCDLQACGAVSHSTGPLRILSIV